MSEVKIPLELIIYDTVNAKSMIKVPYKNELKNIFKLINIIHIIWHLSPKKN